MINFHLDGKKYSLPMSWKELTVSQYIALRAWVKEPEQDFIKLLSIITAAPYATLFNTKQLDVDTKLIPFMDWINTNPEFDKWKMPTAIQIDGKVYNPPSGQGYFCFGQKIALQKKLVEVIQATNDASDCIAFALALYYQPIIQGTKMDLSEAHTLIDKCLQCKLEEAYPVASFFLKKAIDSQKEIQPILRLSQIKNKRVQAFLNWMLLRSSRRLTRLPVVTSLGTKK